MAGAGQGIRGAVLTCIQQIAERAAFERTEIGSAAGEGDAQRCLRDDHALAAMASKSSTTRR